MFFDGQSPTELQIVDLLGEYLSGERSFGYDPQTKSFMYKGYVEGEEVRDIIGCFLRPQDKLRQGAGVWAAFARQKEPIDYLSLYCSKTFLARAQQCHDSLAAMVYSRGSNVPFDVAKETAIEALRSLMVCATADEAKAAISNLINEVEARDF
jgi:hypothetical protein